MHHTGGRKAMPKMCRLALCIVLRSAVVLQAKVAAFFAAACLLSLESTLSAYTSVASESNGIVVTYITYMHMTTHAMHMTTHAMHMNTHA